MKTQASERADAKKLKAGFCFAFITGSILFVLSILMYVDNWVHTDKYGSPSEKHSWILMAVLFLVGFLTACFSVMYYSDHFRIVVSTSTVVKRYRFLQRYYLCVKGKNRHGETIVGKEKVGHFIYNNYKKGDYYPHTNRI